MRPSCKEIGKLDGEFQSTHPSWGATMKNVYGIFKNEISIHAPIVGCDLAICAGTMPKDLFQSTHPSWGATSQHVWVWRALQFQSTHPSWGATLFLYFCQLDNDEFQSTHPSWGATVMCWGFYNVIVFQSTHPSWGATVYTPFNVSLPVISIHAPIVGCDCIVIFNPFSLSRFQSTHPSWGAT